jgi:hypothetical protein
MDAGEFLQSRGVNCDRLPAHAIRKAQDVIQKIESGTSFQALGGKRMLFRRETISIPVGWSYRLIAEEVGTSLRMKSLMSHEAYNKYLKKLYKG